MAIPPKEQMTGDNVSESQFKNGMDNIVDFLTDAEKQSLVLDSESQLQLFKPEVGRRAKTLDSGKVWRWNGTQWTDTGMSEIDQANKYTNSIVKYAHETGELDLNNMNEVKTYLLKKDVAYLNLPKNISRDNHLKLVVSPVSTIHFMQEIFNINSSSSCWSRVCRASDGEGVWRSPFVNYIGDFNAVDPMFLEEPGGYVLTNGIGLPNGFVGAALVEVSVKGGFTVRTVQQTSDASKKWEKIGSGKWFDAMPFALTNDRFPADYNFRGLFTDANFHDFTSEGNYLLNGKYVNGPPLFSDTVKLNVSVLGSFIVHRATSEDNNGHTMECQSKVVSGKRVWTQWRAIGGSITSSLSGKTIAVIGDSIVEQGDWPERVAAQYGATALRFGFGGCRSGWYESSPLGYDKQSMYNIAKNINSGDFTTLIEGAEWTRDNRNDDNTPQAIAMSEVDWNKVDILCIAYGTNDWTGIPAGDELIADPEGKTTSGALCYSVEQIQLKYPHIQIVLIGMSFRLRGSGADESINSDNTPNTYGLYLKEYQQAILDVAEKYHIPAYDMYRLSGVNEMTHKQYLRDGVHPIPESGYRHWANKIGAFLSSNI